MKKLNKTSSIQFVKVEIHHKISDITIVFPSQSNSIITAVIFGRQNRYNHTKLFASNNSMHQKIAEHVKQYLEGKESDFSDIELDMTGLSLFQCAVLRAARTIPRGTTVSYGQLAALAHKPRAVRAAASVMASNRFPIIVPCHRVIRTNGEIGGFMGQIDGTGIELKKNLLALEGIHF